MNLETNAKKFTDPGQRRMASIRCPFCNAHKVEISDITGCNLGEVGRENQENGETSAEGLIYMFAVHCENCQRNYRQTYPASLMPLDFALPV